MMALVKEMVASDPPTPQQLTDAFWLACSGAQLRMAMFLLDMGADLNGTPSWGGDSTPLDAADGQDTGRQALVSWLKERGAMRPSDTTLDTNTKD
jgi:hypothetical protein